MQLDFAFLSQVADFLVTDEKIVAWGVGIDGIEASQMPFQAAPMSLVARVMLLPDEPEQGHTYSVKVINPDHEERVLCENERLNTKHHSSEHPSGSNLIVTLTIFYMSEGLYRFQLIVDGALMKEIPMRISHVPSLARNISLTEGVVNA